MHKTKNVGSFIFQRPCASVSSSIILVEQASGTGSGLAVVRPRVPNRLLLRALSYVELRQALWQQVKWVTLEFLKLHPTSSYLMPCS